MFNTVLFDLDGTLLGLDMKKFMDAYMKEMAVYATEKGLNGPLFVSSLFKGVAAMQDNEGQGTNHDVFWKVMRASYPELPEEVEEWTDEFYTGEHFENVRRESEAKTLTLAQTIIRLLKKKNYRVALATTPLLPLVAVEKRLEWAGLKPSEFELITTYEDYSYAKPDLRYYRAVCEKLGVEPTECYMVGNDMWEDMSARHLGMDVFFCTPYAVNNKRDDITSSIQRGDLMTLLEYVTRLPELPKRPPKKVTKKVVKRVPKDSPEAIAYFQKKAEEEAAAKAAAEAEAAAAEGAEGAEAAEIAEAAEVAEAGSDIQ